VPRAQRPAARGGTHARFPGAGPEGALQAFGSDGAHFHVRRTTRARVYRDLLAAREVRLCRPARSPEAGLPTNEAGLTVSARRRTRRCTAC
jgi:hypothetical protein